MKNENIFQTKLEGTVTNAGDRITHPDTDVSITVPPGAIPVSVGSVTITTRITLFTEYFNTLDPKKKRHEVQVSPIVECCAEGLQGPFLQPVIVSIPHCAYQPDTMWTLIPKVAQGSLESAWKDGTGSKVDWQDIERKQGTPERQQEVSATVSHNLVHIFTHRFSSFTCTACQKKMDAQGLLNMTAVIYGNDVNPRPEFQQVNLRVYICKDFKDAHEVRMILKQYVHIL